MDVHSKSTRSYNMSQVKNKNTKPEELVRKYLFSKGFRYRKNNKKLPGSPDIVLTKYRTAVFVNGCFWHVHESCNHFSLPKTNTEFWKDKLYGNMKRDKRNYSLLKDMGWNVLLVWECELKRENLQKRFDLLLEEIISNNNIK